MTSTHRWFDTVLHKITLEICIRKCIQILAYSYVDLNLVCKNY